MNMYAYVANDPMNHTDPSGETGVHVVHRGLRTAGMIGSAIGRSRAVISACARSSACVKTVRKANKTLKPARKALAAIGIISNNDATIKDAEDIIAGDAEPDDVTSSGTKIFDNPPDDRSADDVMGEVKELPGAETKETSGPLGDVTVVKLPDGSAVTDRNSKEGSRTIETQKPKRKKKGMKVRFPKDKNKPESNG